MAFEYKTVRQVVIPSFPMKGETDYFLKIVSPIKVSDIKPKTGFEAAHVMNVVDVTEESGTVYNTIVNSVLESELVKTYPNESYVGKTFKIRKITTGGKKYHTFGLEEIQVSTPTEAKASKK